MSSLQQRILDQLALNPWQCRASIVEAVQLSAAAKGLEPPDQALVHFDLQQLVSRKQAQMRSGIARAEYALADAPNVLQPRPEYKHPGPARAVPPAKAAPAQALPNPSMQRADRVLAALQNARDGLGISALSKLLTLSHTHLRTAINQLAKRGAISTTMQGDVCIYRAAATPAGSSAGRIADTTTAAPQATLGKGASAPDVQPPADPFRSAAVEPAPSAAVPGVSAPGADVSEPTLNTSPIRQLKIERLAVWSDGVIEIVEPDNSRTLILPEHTRLLARYLSHINEIPDEH